MVGLGGEIGEQRSGATGIGATMTILPASALSNGSISLIVPGWLTMLPLCDKRSAEPAE